MPNAASVMGSNTARRPRRGNGVRAAIAPRLVAAAASIPCVALLRTGIAVLLMGASITWPGAIVLTLVFLWASHAAIVGIAQFAALADKEQATRHWLCFSGAGVMIIGLVCLTGLGGAIAIAPVMLGAWLAAQARTIWLFALGALSFMLGLEALTAFGEQHPAPESFLAIQAMATGVTMLAVSRRWPRSRALYELSA